MKDHHGSVGVGEFPQSFIDAPPEFVLLETGCWIGFWGRQLTLDTARLFFHRFDGFGPHPLLAPQLVEAQVDDDARHPRGETGFALKLNQPLPRFYPCFLRIFQRLVLVPHHHEGPRIDFVTVPEDQLLERLGVSLLSPLDQSLVGF